jgi:hypothetical protein
MPPGLKTDEISIISGWDEIISLGEIMGFLEYRLNIIYYKSRQLKGRL